MVPDDPHPLQNGSAPEAELAFGHFLVPRRTDGSLWELGRGAMGVTYRAFDTSLQTEVALKVIRSDRVSEDVARRRFQREARSAAKVRHPNIASVLYLGEQGGEFYYAMEFVPGHSLADLLRETNGPLPPAVAVALAAQAAAALNAAHKKELIHRDLKPQNLMLLEGEHLDHADERTRAAGNRLLKVIDFGLARSFAAERKDESLVTQTSSGFIGTPAYASPEQGAGVDDLDGRSDLYSLGIILWQMLTGQLPFNGPVIKVLVEHQSKAPPFEQLANVPAPLVELLNGLLAKEPTARWPQNAGELRDKLDECLRELASGTTSARSKPELLPIPAAIERRPPTETAGPIAPAPPLEPVRQVPTNVINPAAARPETRQTIQSVATRWNGRVPLIIGILFVLTIIVTIGFSIAAKSPRLSAPEPSPVVATPPDASSTQQPSTVANTSTAVSPTISFTPQATISPEQIQPANALRYLEEARTTVNAIISDYIKAFALSDIATAQAKAGDLTGSRETFAQAKVIANAIISDSSRASMLSDIATAQAKAGDLTGSRETFAQAKVIANAIISDSSKASAWSGIAVAQAKAGDVTGAKATASAITDNYIKASAWSDIAVAQAKAGDLSGSRATLTQARTAANAITGDYAKVSAWSGIAVAQAKAGDPTGSHETFTQARTTANAIIDAFSKASALSGIAAAQAKAGDLTGAKATADAIIDDQYRALALSGIAAAQAARGDVPRAKATANAIIDDRYKASALRSIAAAQAKAGDLSGAKATANAITINSDQVSALSSIAAAQAKAEGFPSAEQWVEALTDPWARMRCYIALAEVRLNPSGQIDTNED